MSQLQKGDLYSELTKEGHFPLVSSSGRSWRKYEQSLHFAILLSCLLITTC